MNLPIRSTLFIGGAFEEPLSREAEAVFNPATGEIFAEAPLGGEADLESAISAARASFDRGVWRNVSARQRVEKMQIFHDHLMHRIEEIIPLIVTEAGALVGMARMAQFHAPMKNARYYLEAALQPSMSMAMAEVSPNAQGGKTLGAAAILRDPVGVVAAITAYNYPFMLNLVKCVAALLMGNSVVLKPSPYTPFEALILGDAALAAGLPAGVFNVITGGPEIGKRLTTDPRVDLVSFTGSDVVGAAIAVQAAPTLKRVIMELGGKSAMIVQPDANLERALAAGLNALVSHSGQACVCLSRHLVHNSIREDYVAKLRERVNGIRIGDPADPTSQMGPLIRNVACERVERYVASTIKAGGKLVFGGRRPNHTGKGYFYEPTLFDSVDNSWPIAQEEVFGPVAVVIGYDTDEEAIQLANDTNYGLNAAIFSADAGRAFEMAKELRSGGVSLNGGAGTMLSDAPFGGIKRSGYGREMGAEGLWEFSQTKTIGFNAA